MESSWLRDADKGEACVGTREMRPVELYSEPDVDVGKIAWIVMPK